MKRGQTKSPQPPLQTNLLEEEEEEAVVVVVLEEEEEEEEEGGYVRMQIFAFAQIPS